MRRNRHLHPSRQKLQDWLGGERPELDEHIHNCFRCAERLEESNQAANPIAAALTTLLAPPANLQPRLSRGISVKLQSRSDWMLVGDLLTVSWRTVRAVSLGGNDE